MSNHDEAVVDIKKAKDVLDAFESGTPKSEVKYPDAKKHLYVSLAKSVVRVAAGMALIAGSLLTAGAFLIAAEVLGVVEELV